VARLAPTGVPPGFPEPGPGRPVTGQQPAGAPVSRVRVVRLAGISLVFMSGHVAVDSSGRVIGAADVGAQLAQVYRNIADAIGSAGGRMSDVVRLRTFLTRPEDLAGFRAARAALHSRYWGTGPYPVNTLVVVTRLASPEYLVEIEATAVTGGPE
jgi:enamine deaminase RidA (YjgF/YER057c/UK114 family)